MKIENSNVVLSTNSARFSYRSTGGFSEIYSKIKDSVTPSSSQNRYHAPSAPELYLSLHKVSPALRQTKVTVTEVKSYKTFDVEDRSLDVELDEQDERKLALLEQLLEKLTGKKVKFHFKAEAQATANNNNSYNIILVNAGQHRLHQSNPGPAVQSTVRNSQASMPFKAEGLIKTSDGREINFSLESDLNAGSVALSVPSEGSSNAVDPLVVNFGSASARLTNVKFDFDLDSDGKLESISFPSPESGFLALDKNNDGIINNGSELFGPSNGDGFSELAQYDTDSNNWIDENDEVFSKLKIWSKDSNGNDTIGSAITNGIGAIFLGSIQTSVNLTGNNGENSGQVAQTGVFLHENGTVGTIQHVNLNL